VKSLNDRYAENQANTHETFADLIFCALVVLLLFVLALAVEVSQRVRTKLADVPEVEIVEDPAALTAEEVADLSRKLQQQKAEFEKQRSALLRQQEEIAQLRELAQKKEERVDEAMSALRGEQRFTGATEPAVVMVAYDYKQNRFAFVRQKEFEHATTKQSGESPIEFRVRQVSELVDLAILTRNQRLYSRDEANAIYSAFTTYRQIHPTETSYTITDERLGVTYSIGLSGYIAGDEEVPGSGELAIEMAVNTSFGKPRRSSDAMYPSATIRVDVKRQRIVVGGIELSPKDFKDVLLSIGGRGVMLDFEGYSDAAPSWLMKQVLEPTGYIGKTPKLPGE
jgi:hypothetical protein